MVKIAISGGSGEIAHEIIDHLIATGKHEIVILSRKDPTSNDTIQPGTSWVKVNYEDKNSLVQSLQGVHTVLCFITAHLDPEGTAQKNLIGASIEAGVKRFAPSEWSVSDNSTLPWYASKILIQNYLADLNKDKKILEYTLFQPGMLLDYLANPHKTSPHLTQLEINIDIQNRRAILLSDSPDDTMVWTSLHDLASIVTQAISYEGEWPVNGGITGNRISTAELITLAEKIRGGKFNIEKVRAEDLKKGVVTSSWVPMVRHPSVPIEEVEGMSRMFLEGFLVGVAAGAYRVGDDWNRLLGGYKFLGVEEFLRGVWGEGGNE